MMKIRHCSGRKADDRMLKGKTARQFAGSREELHILNVAGRLVMAMTVTRKVMRRPRI